MKKTPAEKYGIDMDYLRRSKQSTPEQTLTWLAAAREFAFAPKRTRPVKVQKKK